MTNTPPPKPTRPERLGNTTRHLDWIAYEGFMERYADAMEARDRHHEQRIGELKREVERLSEEYTCESCGASDSGSPVNNTCAGCGLVVCAECCTVFGHIEDEGHGTGDPADEVRRLRHEVERLREAGDCRLRIELGIAISCIEMHHDDPCAWCRALTPDGGSDGEG